ncbi:MAG: hypothetical protein HY925_02120 [Elusimicrobia bacterium]|nr:hypothetical protein [Elusimicrobiota bacterium]
MATIPIMAGTVLAIALVHLVKRFRSLSGRDPFHDSRRHPLNDPGAPRG